MRHAFRRPRRAHTSARRPSEAATGEVRDKSLELCRVFGTGVVHVNNLPPSTAVGYLNSRGKPAAGVEIGGTYMAGPMTEEFVSRIVRGLTNQMKSLGMLEGAPELPAKQYLFTRKERKRGESHQGRLCDQPCQRHSGSGALGQGRRKTRLGGRPLYI